MEINEFKKNLVAHSFSTTGRLGGQDPFIWAPFCFCWGRIVWFLSQINHQETAEQNMAFRGGFFFFLCPQNKNWCVLWSRNIEAATWYPVTANTDAVFMHACQIRSQCPLSKSIWSKVSRTNLNERFVNKQKNAKKYNHCVKSMSLFNTKPSKCFTLIGWCEFDNKSKASPHLSN